MPGEFLNTYHFVPVRDGGPTLGPTHDLENVRVALANDRAGAKEWDIWSHDRWHDGHLSGRITCTLTTEDPLVIGAEQKRGENGETCTIVAPYLLDGKPAIPPTTLKGMLSALIEAATNSAMRVLDDRALSVRQDMNKALSAIGMVMRKPGVAQTESEGWDLIPLTLPTIKLKPGAGYPESPPPSFPIPHSFLTLMKTLRWKPAQKVFVGTLTWPKAPPGTNRQEPPTPDEDFKFMMRAGTYSSAAPATYLMDITPLPLTPDGKAITYKPLVTRVKQLQTPGKPEFLIGQKSRNSKLSRPILESDVPEEQRQTMTRGILRVMHHDDRVNDLPHTRKHEVFIPLPQDLECAPRLPIPSAVVRLFHALADERTQTQSGGRDQSEWGALPFHPVGTRRAESPAPFGNALRLKEGDLVFFDLKTGTDKQLEVAAISFSSIWRQSKESVYDYVPKDAQPLTSNRSSLSPTELMFGVVEVRPEDTAGTDGSNTIALKGRVRCGPARCERGQDAFMTPDPSVRLKILASPKPPSPALYFRPKGVKDGFIAKTDLASANHEIRGRKMYLHPTAQALGVKAVEQSKSRTPENDPSNNQRNMVRPVKPGVTFTFSIDFDDLPTECLDLLLFACRPTKDFRHRLGMGKALGLGRVRVDVTEVSVIDRGRRYRVDDPFTTKRAHRLWSDGVGDADLDPAQAARRVVDKMDDVILAHLLGIGEPRHIGDRPVHPPYTDDQQAAFLKRLSGAEEKTYAWFVEVYTRGPANQKFLQDIRLTRSPPGTDDPVATIEMLSLPTTGATLPRKGSRADRPPPPSPKPAGPAKPAGPEIRGTVKHYDPIKGRGYIIPDGKGSDILIEKAVLKACGMGRLKKNDRVVVITKDQGGKPVAIDVRR